MKEEIKFKINIIQNKLVLVGESIMFINSFNDLNYENESASNAFSY